MEKTIFHSHLAATLILLLGLQGCEFPGDPQVRRVSIVLKAALLGEDAFYPNPVIVPWGGRVVWINRDNSAHSIVGDAKEGPCAFESPPIGPGKRFSHTFFERVQCNYFCGLHGRSMRGRIEVE